MTTALAGALDLLDRSLGYTRVALAGVRADHLGRATPCRGWTLGRLLAHMEDGLDAFTEAAAGRVTAIVPAAGRPPAERLQVKACHLLGVWSRATPDGVDIAGAALPTELLVATASLEITVHGWDVGRSLGLDHPVPDNLASRLHEVAERVVTPADRGGRFAPPVTTSPTATPGVLLLAHLGRPDWATRQNHDQSRVRDPRSS